MAEILGFLAGSGMAVLVFVLVTSFLRQMEWVQKNTARVLLRTAVLICGAGTAYLLLALLHHLATYGKIEGALGLGTLFHGAYLTRMLTALSASADIGPVSLTFAWISRGLGRILFDQYVFCGILLAWMITGTGVCLIQLRLQKITDDNTALDAALLLLFLPGGVLFLLPGWAPVCLLLVAVLFFVATRRAVSWKLQFSSTAYGWLIAVCALLSAAVTICAAEGRIG